MESIRATLQGWTALLCCPVIFDDGWKSPVDSDFSVRMEMINQYRDSKQGTKVFRPRRSGDQREDLTYGWHYRYQGGRVPFGLERAGVFLPNGQQLTGVRHQERLRFIGDFDGMGLPAVGVWQLQDDMVFIGRMDRGGLGSAYVGTLYRMSSGTAERGTFDASSLHVRTAEETDEPLAADHAMRFLSKHPGDDQHFGFVSQVFEAFHRRRENGLVLWDVDKTMGHRKGREWCYRPHFVELVRYLNEAFPCVAQGVLTSRKSLKIRAELGSIKDFLDRTNVWSVGGFQECHAGTDTASVGEEIFLREHFCQAAEADRRVYLSGDMRTKYGILLTIQQETGRQVCLIDDLMSAPLMQKYTDQVLYSRPWNG